MLIKAFIKALLRASLIKPSPLATGNRCCKICYLRFEFSLTSYLIFEDCNFHQRRTPPSLAPKSAERRQVLAQPSLLGSMVLSSHGVCSMRCSSWIGMWMYKIEWKQCSIREEGVSCDDLFILICNKYAIVLFSLFSHPRSSIATGPFYIFVVTTLATHTPTMTQDWSYRSSLSCRPWH